MSGTESGLRQELLSHGLLRSWNSLLKSWRRMTLPGLPGPGDRCDVSGRVRTETRTLVS